MNYKIATFLILISVNIFSCQKSGVNIQDAPQNNRNETVNQPPQWRIKQILTSTINIKLDRGFDTTYFSYDSLGRFLSISYSVLVYNFTVSGNGVGYSQYSSGTRKYEYLDNTEKLKKEYLIDHVGNPLSPVNEYFYNNAQTEISGFYSHELIGTPIQDYINLAYNNDKLAGYTYLQHLSATIIDTTVTKIYYTNNLISKKQDIRYDGGNINTYSYEYDAVGNPTYSFAIGQYDSLRPDTMRKIYFTWKPSITLNLNKLKRLDRTFDNYIYRWPNFYWPTFNQLTEFDFFNLTSNGELLNSYNFPINKYTIMVNKMNFQYELDSNQNINKIIGLVPGSNASMEMKIQYEKIQ